jgi:hypothetical protein
MLSCQIRDGFAWASVLSPAYVSVRELLGALRALERSTHFPRGTGLLLDARAVSPDARGHTPSELSLAAFDLVTLGIGRCAVVPVPERVDRAQRFADAAKAESLPTAVFLEPELALHWLRTGKRNDTLG